MKKFGRNLRRLRKIRFESASELARKVKRQTCVIGYWERGEGKDIQLSSIELLADAFDMNLFQFLVAMNLI